MKELSIEEKAQRFDEAIERAKAYQGLRSEMEIIFPELKESEGERIWIINYLNNRILNSTIIAEKENLKKAIAWLEKQGEPIEINPSEFDLRLNKLLKQFETLPKEELASSLSFYLNVVQNGTYKEEKQGGQKPADKVEPKFKVGDWVVWDNKIFCHVDNIYQGKESLMYTITDTNNMIRSYSAKSFDNNTHLWTIQDAKDGDVLSYRDGQWIFIYKEKIDDSTFCYHTLYSTIHQDLTINDSAFTLLGDAIIPATKEQRDLLFQKMHEAGYEWDAKHKQLKKIEQKPSWSEEDEYLLDETIKHLEALIRITKKQGNAYSDEIKYYQRDIDLLKHLKDRVRLQNGYNPYKEVVESIAEMCKHYDKISHSGLRDFYDNVKVKCKDAKEYDSLCPQNTWKPSDLQIECLSDAIKHYNSQGYTAPVLKELLEQLKKLREE